MSDANRTVGDSQSYAESIGLDTCICEICEEPLDDSEPWKRGLDGCGAHLRCIERYV